MNTGSYLCSSLAIRRILPALAGNRDPGGKQTKYFNDQIMKGGKTDELGRIKGNGIYKMRGFIS